MRVCVCVCVCVCVYLKMVLKSVCILKYFKIRKNPNLIREENHIIHTYPTG